MSWLLIANTGECFSLRLILNAYTKFLYAYYALYSFYQNEPTLPLALGLLSLCLLQACLCWLSLSLFLTTLSLSWRRGRLASPAVHRKREHALPLFWCPDIREGVNSVYKLYLGPQLYVSILIDLIVSPELIICPLGQLLSLSIRPCTPCRPCWTHRPCTS